MEYYIYRYFNSKNKVIYVGLTGRPIKRRVYEHKTEDLQKETDHIDFATVATESDMRMYELYYINKYQPKYNRRDMYIDGQTLHLPELTFQPYLEEQESENAYVSSVDKRDYVFRCTGGNVILSILNPYDKRPEKAVITVEGNPELNRQTLESLMELMTEVHDDLYVQI